MLLQILVCLLLTNSTTSTNTRSYAITYTQAKLIHNEHVGNEWARGVWLGEERLRPGQAYRIPAGSSPTLSVAAEETNEKYNDRGDASIILTATKLARAHADGGFTLDVTVVERNGRYAGGRAVWRFWFLVK